MQFLPFARETFLPCCLTIPQVFKQFSRLERNMRILFVDENYQVKCRKQFSAVRDSGNQDRKKSPSSISYLTWAGFVIKLICTCMLSNFEVVNDLLVK